MTAAGDTKPADPGSGKPAFSLLGPALVYAAYIFVAGSLPDVAPPMGASDKAAHLVAFGLMVPLFTRALRIRGETSRLSRIWISVGISSGLGALLELWQALLPYRSAELLDWVADTAGAGLAGALLTGLALLSASPLGANEPGRRDR